MAITDRTRKVLWARSGNRCAHCRSLLVLPATERDSESVVGEEAHIHSAKPSGPRHDSSLSAERLDDIGNLILLCSVHHKMIDDQVETFPAERVRSMKQEHEQWVQALTNGEPVRGVRVVRDPNRIPETLTLVNNGRELYLLASGCAEGYHDYENDMIPDEAQLVAGFLQDLQDGIGIASELGPGAVIEAEQGLSKQLGELAEAGFLVFAARERMTLEGGVNGPCPWDVLHITVLRATSPRLVKMPTVQEQEIS